MVGSGVQKGLCSREVHEWEIGDGETREAEPCLPEGLGGCGHRRRETDLILLGRQAGGRDGVQVRQTGFQSMYLPSLSLRVHRWSGVTAVPASQSQYNRYMRQEEQHGG